MEVATKVLSEFHRETNGEILLVGVGGVANGYDAYQKIRAGAKLVQLYTALTYAGPGLIHDLKRDLAARLKADGFQTLAEAVGTGISNEKEQS